MLQQTQVNTVLNYYRRFIKAFPSIKRLSQADLPGLRAGDVIACRNARLEEGCGHTEHCLGCAVLRAARETFASGEPQERITTLKEVVTPS